MITVDDSGLSVQSAPGEQAVVSGGVHIPDLKWGPVNTTTASEVKVPVWVVDLSGKNHLFLPLSKNHPFLLSLSLSLFAYLN